MYCIVVYMRKCGIILQALTMRNETVAARIEKDLKKLLEQVCKARGEDVSTFIRRSVRKELANLSYFDEADKKALGIKIENRAS
jgi:hypothetical protein